MIEAIRGMCFVDYGKAEVKGTLEAHFTEWGVNSTMKLKNPVGFTSGLCKVNIWKLHRLSD